MPEILVVDGVEYYLYTPKDETDDFHSMVKEHYKKIFGEDSLYFDVRKKLKSKSKIGSIPDAYIINFKRDEWYVVEEELSYHPVYNHIVNQLTRFLNGIKNMKSRSQLLEALYREIDKDEVLRNIAKKQINSHDIHHALTKLISKQPSIIVIIEEKTMETEEAIESIHPSPHVIEFKTYARKDSPDIRAHLFEPLCKTMVSEGPKPQTLPIDSFIEQVDVSIRDVARALIERISQLGNVVFRGKTSYSAYIGKRRVAYGFVGIAPRKSTLKIYVRTNSPTFSDPKGWMDTKKAKWFTKYEEGTFTITTKDQIDYTMELIKQSYQIVQHMIHAN